MTAEHGAPLREHGWGADGSPLANPHPHVGDARPTGGPGGGVELGASGDGERQARADANVFVDAILLRLDTEATLLRADAMRADEVRRLGPAVVALLRDAGCFRITADPLVGGLGAGTAPLVRLARGLAALHPSAAWNCVVSNSHAATAGSFATPPRGDDTLPDADISYCGVYGSTDAQTRRHGDGVLLDGTWPNASNARHAQWATIDAAHEQFGRVFLMVPVRELDLRDTWHVLGMRGTGSDTLIARDVFVPTSRLVTVADLERRGRERNLALRIPKPVRTSFGLAAVGLGAARAFADAVAARGEPVRRVSPLLPFPVEGPSGFVPSFVQATSRLDAADLVLLDTARALDEHVTAGGTFAGDAAIAARTRLARAVRDAADAVHELSLQCGSATTFEGSAIGMYWRDAHVALRHGALSAATGFDIGGPFSVRSHAARGREAPPRETRSPIARNPVTRNPAARSSAAPQPSSGPPPTIEQAAPPIE